MREPDPSESGGGSVVIDETDGMTAAQLKRRNIDLCHRYARRHNRGRRREFRENADSAIAAAARRSGLSMAKAKLFMSCLVDEMSDRLVSGQILNIPRLFFMYIIPHRSSPRGFAVRFCADSAIRLRIRQEMNMPSEKDVMTFRRLCNAVRCSVPPYQRRGLTWGKLMEQDRRAASREARDRREFVDLERAAQKEVPNGTGQQR